MVKVPPIYKYIVCPGSMKKQATIVTFFEV
jgi:hypothetical protein